MSEHEPKAASAPIPDSDLDEGIDEAAFATETDEFQDAFGEPLAAALDLKTWQPDLDIGAILGSLRSQVRLAVNRETRHAQIIREQILPQLSRRANRPPGGGWYQASDAELERAYRHILFPGLVEACDGSSHLYDALPVSIAQISICLISYRGSQSSWSHTLFRRDLHMSAPNPLEEVYALLDRRKQRPGLGVEERYDRLSELASKGLMAYAERAVLLSKAQAPWRLGHGSAIPFPLLTGRWSMGLLEHGLRLLRELVAFRRLVFVASAPRARHLQTIGGALRPLEFAIIEDMTGPLREVVNSGHYRSPFREWVDEFVAEVGPQVVRGVYRASELAAPQVFQAHRDHAQEAALIALADSALQGHRGFPALIDLADQTCRHTFSQDSFQAAVQSAYADAGAFCEYFSERDLRD